MLDPLELVLQMTVSHRTGGWEMSLGPLQKQPVPLATEPVSRHLAGFLYVGSRAQTQIPMLAQQALRMEPSPRPSSPPAVQPQDQRPSSETLGLFHPSYPRVLSSCTAGL